MKKFIRYLYEYQNGKRVQNAGFVRAEEADDFAVLQIYGKGFPAAGNQSLEILLFYLMGNQCVGISMGKVRGGRPMFGYRLEYTADDVGGMDIFNNIEGIILLNDVNGFRKWYGAVWNERPVNIEQMIRREDVLREREPGKKKEQENSGKEEDGPQEERTPENEIRNEDIRQRNLPENDMQSDSVDENIEKNQRIKIENDRKNEAQRNVNEDRNIQENRVQQNEVQVEERREDESSNDNARETMTERVDEKTEDVEETIDEKMPEQTVIHKITRQDMAKLPRREWKLANNSFLLHGCHNYHHLVSFEKDGKCWLGVPGIYHPKEQRAASAFGFGQFMKPGEGEIVLSEDEMNPQEDFGYWCRPVSSVI